MPFHKQNARGWEKKMAGGGGGGGRDAMSRHARGTLITALLLVLGVGVRPNAARQALMRYKPAQNVTTKQFTHWFAWNRGSKRQNYIMQWSWGVGGGGGGGGKENLYNYLCQQVFRKHTDSSHSNGIDKTYWSCCSRPQGRLITTPFVWLECFSFCLHQSCHSPLSWSDRQ